MRYFVILSLLCLILVTVKANQYVDSDLLNGECVGGRNACFCLFGQLEAVARLKCRVVSSVVSPYGIKIVFKIFWAFARFYERLKAPRIQF